MSTSKPGDKLKWILIVEDDSGLREALAAFLTKHGYRPVTSSKVSDAINKVNNQKFSCILVDIKLEHRNGDQIIEYIRSEENNPNYDSPVIVVSGFLDAGLIKRIGKLVSGILVKPFENAALLGKIQSVIEAPSVRMAK